MVIPPSPSKSLVVMPPVVWDDHRLSVRTNGVSQQMIRFAALYWDGMDIPLPLCPEQDAVEDYEAFRSYGLLRPIHPTQSEFDRASRDLASRSVSLEMGTLVFNRVHHQNLQDLFGEVTAIVDPGRDAPLILAGLRGAFSLIEASGAKSAGYFGPTMPNVVGDQRALEFRLYQALSVPINATPGDLLAFKSEHRGALEQLRGYINEIHLGVLAAGDQSWAHDAALRKLKGEALAVERGMQRKGWQTWKLDFLSEISLAAFGGAAVSARAGLDELAASLAMAGAADLLRIKLRKQRLLPSESDFNDRFAYYVTAKSGLQ